MIRAQSIRSFLELLPYNFKIMNSFDFGHYSNHQIGRIEKVDRALLCDIIYVCFSLVSRADQDKCQEGTSL